MAERHNTQLYSIRKHLLQGKSITPLEALARYGCLRLSAHIFTLRHEELFPIEMDKPQASDNKPYARYWISKDCLAAYQKKYANVLNDN